ncbi:uncharacterized protein LOC107365580 [Tetranychus urticae]|uniref:Uncharacterized protein n=1 Tax=Tetranychus urticae TaxID=32264 RepID=T1KML7_TETUR|nr:uncharacterized protein LOC107365580 [Tetranychus urticae]
MSSNSLSNTMSSDCLPSESLVSSNTVGFLGESSSGYDEDEESSENILCSWCQKMGPKMFTLRCTNGLKAFCSELCLTQCRRASFKKNKVCDWCKHVRHTVNYVDFQDGQQQLQFCSDKCLNQYKMNIFCRETQVHLNSLPTVYRSTSPSTSCPSHLHGLNRILDNNMTIKEIEDSLVNPEFRMKNLLIPNKQFPTSLITSTSSPSSGSISNGKSDSMANFRCSLIEKSIDNSTNKTTIENKDKVGKEEPSREYKPSVPKKSPTKSKVRRQMDPKNKCTTLVKVEEISESTKLRSCKNQRNTIGDENQNNEPSNIELGKDLQPKSVATSKITSNQSQEPIIDPSTSSANGSMPLLSRFTPNLLQNHANGFRTVYNNDSHISPFPDYLSQRLSNLPNRDGSLNSMGSFLNPLQLELLRHRTFNSPIRHSMFPLSSPVVANQPDQRPSIQSIYSQLPESHHFNSQPIPFNEQNNLTNARIQYSVPHPFLFPLPLPIPLPIPIPIDLASLFLKPTISTQDKEVQVNVYERSGFITLDSKITPDNDDQSAGFIKNKRFKRDIISI